MGIRKPYHRNFRGFIDGENSGYSSWGYIIDKEYARSPEHFIRAFFLIQDDLKELFEYVEPSPVSMKTFSYRIHELLMRTCIEIEANFKAILAENHYTKSRADITVYKKINVTHRLSSYKVILPIWNGKKERVFKPFIDWDNNKPLPWYQAYNKSKHDRQEKFQQANLKNLLDAVTALLILLSSQFKTEDFSPSSRGFAASGYDYHEMGPALGDYFRIEFPTDWPEDEKYDFDWSKLKKTLRRFDKINYNEI